MVGIQVGTLVWFMHGNFFMARDKNNLDHQGSLQWASTLHEYVNSQISQWNEEFWIVQRRETCAGSKDIVWYEFAIR